MIETRIVLILGAGASNDFDFPLGWTLLQFVCAGCANQNSNFFKLLKGCGYMADEISTFGNELRRSGQQSVDAFLEKRPEYLDIGKAAISCALVPLEYEETLINPDKGVHWYKYLFGKMDAGSLDEFQNNKISFITFNYDRSLEHFLFLSLKHSYDKPDRSTALTLERIPIVHVYGQLGKYSYTGQEGRTYESLVNKEIIDQCVAEITIVHEGARLDTFSRVHELLGRAEKVCFLGFGYHRTNLERLKLGRVPKEAALIGSAVNMEAAEKGAAQLSIKNLSGRGIQLEDADVRMMLRRHDALS